MFVKKKKRKKLFRGEGSLKFDLYWVEFLALRMTLHFMHFAGECYIRAYAKLKRSKIEE